MLNQQLDIDGGRHDLAPASETLKLFDSSPQIRGQIALETDGSIETDNSPETVERRRRQFESLGWSVTR